MQVPMMHYQSPTIETIPIDVLVDWTPLKFFQKNGQHGIVWGDLKGIPLDSERFFSVLVRKYLESDQYETIETGVEALSALRAINPGLAPQGFIFHVSHCGSTLISNILGTLESCVSLSEPRFFTPLLPTAHGISRDQLSSWFCDTVNAYGQRRLGVEENLFIKFNSWHLFNADFIRYAFPKTPWLCLYRHPVEVMMGQLKKEKSQMTGWLTNNDRLNLTLEDRLQMSIVEGMALMLGRYYRRIESLATTDANVLCINYDQFSSDTYARILAHFMLDVTADEFAQMCEVTKLYSKAGSQKKEFFQDDRHKKQKDAFQIVREMVNKWAIQPYNALEATRIQKDARYQ
ncbi:MAG: hypothetical protein AAF485_09650 [Chloroflexota bacterium]